MLVVSLGEVAVQAYLGDQVDLAAVNSPLAQPVRQHLGLTANARVLVIATESPAAAAV